MQFPIYTFILNMICFIDDYFLQSITAVLIDWFLPKMNMLKGLIKMKKHFQVTLFFLAWGVLCSTVGIFFLPGIIRAPSRARLAMHDT